MICRPHGAPNGRGRRAAGGFTLIELLVVVAIISILASIAMPNFLEAQTRAKVSRVKADMRTLATALESYRVDNNNYPPRQLAPRSPDLIAFGQVLKRAEDLSRLTTPIAHITTIPADVFETRVPPPNHTFDYWPRDFVFIKPSGPQAGQRRNGTLRGIIPNWLLVSNGPDATLNVPALAADLPYGLTGWDLEQHGYRYDYDPTNGTISQGNIYRGSGGEQASDIWR